jgi:hypothetical protein
MHLNEKFVSFVTEIVWRILIKFGFRIWLVESWGSILLGYGAVSAGGQLSVLYSQRMESF